MQNKDLNLNTEKKMFILLESHVGHNYKVQRVY